MEQRQVRSVPELAKGMHWHDAKRKKPNTIASPLYIDLPCFSKETIVLQGLGDVLYTLLPSLIFYHSLFYLHFVFTEVKIDFICGV